MMPAFDYPTLLACLAVLVIMLYVTLDGFDLGVGILFPFAPSTEVRDTMMETLAPTWDGNETWLVLGGMVLLAGFPGAFTILLPAFYVLLFLMLLGLVLRGVAFEFRSQRGRFQIFWSAAFAGGSALAAFCQGAIFGAFIDRNIAVKNHMFAGGPLDWLHLFSIMTGLGVLAGYALLGAGWLMWRTAGNTQIFGREIALPAHLALAAAIIVVTVWTPLIRPEIASRWFGWPGLLGLAVLPGIAAVAWGIGWAHLWKRRDWVSFAATVVIFACGLCGAAISVWPDAIPGALTIWDAAAEERTLTLITPPLVLIVPVILAYVAYSYWVFRGKITDGGPSGYSPDTH